jgi:hypothetical protein
MMRAWRCNLFTINHIGSGTLCVALSSALNWFHSAPRSLTCAARCCTLKYNKEPPIRDHQSAATSLDYDANSPRITCDFGRFYIHIQYVSFCAQLHWWASTGNIFQRFSFVRVWNLKTSASRSIWMPEDGNWKVYGWIYSFVYIILCADIALCRVRIYSRVLNCPAQNSIPSSGWRRFPTSACWPAQRTDLDQDRRFRPIFLGFSPSSLLPKEAAVILYMASRLCLKIFTDYGKLL